MPSPRSFNPLPPPKRGETATTEATTNQREVSIHSPRRSEGRRVSKVTPCVGKEVSIHSPRRSEGRRELFGRGFQGEVSIHSPRRSEGRPATENVYSAERTSFNPLPPPKRGETSQCAIEIG